MRFIQSAFLVTLLLGSGAVDAQSRSVQEIDERLQRVEQVLDRSLFELLQEVEGLRSEIRQLRGEIEALSYESDKQSRRNRELYRDSDQRMLELEQRIGGLSGQPAGGGPEAPGGLDEVGAEARISEPEAEAVAAQSRAVIVAESGRGASTSREVSAPRVPVVRNNTRAATQEEKQAYTDAYDLLAKGENEASIKAFNDFIRQYPDGPFSDNAWYWQGEARYSQRDFDTALRNFAVVVDSFPESTKVPDARLKIGFSLYEQQRDSDARKVLESVMADYPGRSVSVLARKRLREMDQQNR